MSESISSGTGQGLLEFLQWAIDKNEIGSSNGGALKTAAKNVMSVEDDPSQVVLRTLDLDRFVRRFMLKSRGQYKDASQVVYTKRFRQAVTMYMLWLDGKDWRPSQGRATGSSHNSSSGSPEKRPATPSVDKKSGHANAAIQPSETTAPTLEHTFPLRPGRRARLMLPEDLTTSEATRLAIFVRALAIEGDQEPAE